MSDWSRAGSRHAETIMLMSLHVAVKIQAFSRASRAFGFANILRRSAKILPSLVGVVSGQRGIRVRRLR